MRRKNKIIIIDDDIDPITLKNLSTGAYIVYLEDENDDEVCLEFKAVHHLVGEKEELDFIVTRDKIIIKLKPKILTKLSKAWLKELEGK